MGPEDDAGPAGEVTDLADSGAPAAVAAPLPPRRPRPIFLVIGIVLAAALAVGLFTTLGNGGTKGSTRPVAGGPVPTFSLPRLGGGARVGVPADGGGHGQPAVLLFFASWCTPCRAELPAVAALHAHQQATGSPLAKVAVIGVDGNDPAATGLAFTKAAGVTFPVGADRTYAVTEGLFYFTGLPESVYVNADGTIAGIHIGAVTAAQFAVWERRLLTGG